MSETVIRKRTVPAAEIAKESAAAPDFWEYMESLIPEDWSDHIVPDVTVTNNREKADYVVLLDHEGGKGGVHRTPNEKLQRLLARTERDQQRI